MDEKTVKSEVTPLLKKEQSGVVQLLKSFVLLKDSPRDFFITIPIIILMTSTYQTLMIASTLYMIEIWGFSDILAGTIFASYGVVGTVYCFFVGTIPDWIGVKSTYILVSVLGLTGYISLIFVPVVFIQIILLLFVVLTSNLIFFACHKLAIAKLTTLTTRPAGFSLYNACVHISGLTSGIYVDSILTLNGENKLSFQLVFGICALFFGISLLLSFALDRANLHEENLQNTNPSIFSMLKEIYILKRFWRLLTLILLTVLIRTAFVHSMATLPIYMHREIGSDSHYGIIFALESIFLIIFSLSMTFIVYYMSLYSTLILAGVISTISPLILIFGAEYWAILVFVILVGLGEGICTPRMIEYTKQVALQGREGVFMSLNTISLVLSLTVSGLSSGWLLGEYCPSEGERNCWIMWYIISGICCIGTLLMVILRPYIEQPSEEAEPNCWVRK